MAYSFSYKKNCFYIEDHKNTLSDNEIYGDGKSLYATLTSLTSGNDVESIDNAITLNHEVNHYMQDLSINACIVQGTLLDYIAACSKELSRVPAIRFPLNQKNNYEYNHQLTLSQEEDNVLHVIDKLYEIYDFIFVRKHCKPITNPYSYNSIHESLFTENPLSVDYILETYAYHKAYWDSFLYCNSHNESLLHEIVKRNKVYPVIFRNNSYVVNNLKYDIEWNKPYQVINLLLLLGLDNKDNQAYLNYCENYIPRNYRESPAINIHSAYRLIFETALNIPSLSHIMTEVYDHQRNIEEFSPVHRFYLIIKAIRENNGYPEAVKGEDFFKTFHDWVSNIYGWLSFEETYNSISYFLYKRAEESKEVIVNFQLTALYHKHKDFKRFIQKQPLDVISSLGLPVIINNSKGFIFNQFIGNFIYSSAGLIDCYSSFFGDIVKYQTYSLEETSADKISIIMNNNKGALREIVNRLFSSATINKYLNKGVWRCPFSQYGCIRASQACDSFENFIEILTKCEYKILRTREYKSYLPNGGGNVKDCMFYNYILDNNYNFK